MPSIDDGEGTYSFETLRTHHQCHSVIPKKYGILKNFFIASVLKIEAKFTLNNTVFLRTENLSRL